eukprot:936678-Rhodomonas_salina.3
MTATQYKLYWRGTKSHLQMGAQVQTRNRGSSLVNLKHVIYEFESGQTSAADSSLEVDFQVERRPGALTRETQRCRICY